MIVCMSGISPLGLQIGHGFLTGVNPPLHFVHCRNPMKEVPLQKAHFSVLSYQQLFLQMEHLVMYHTC